MTASPCHRRRPDGTARVTQRTYRRAGGPGRRTRPIRRASAGLTPVRAGAALAMLVSAGAIYGLAATSAFGFDRLEIDGSDDHAGGGDPGPARTGRGHEPVRDRDRAARGAPPRDPGGRRRRDLARPARHRRRPDRRARADPRLADRGPAPRSSTTPGCSSPSSTRRHPPAVAELPVDHRRPGGLAGSSRVGATARPGRSRRGDAPRLADARPRSAAARPGCPSASPTRTASCSSSVPESWVAVFGFYGPSLRTPDLVPGQVQLLRELLTGRRADRRDSSSSPTIGTGRTSRSRRRRRQPRRRLTRRDAALGLPLVARVE